MRLLEIGPLAAPIVPKRHGWNTQVVDRENREQLSRTYSCLGAGDEQLKEVEEVDIIWRDGAFHDAFPPSDHGTFDALIASHVLEHLIDPISFLQSVPKLLKPSGELLLLLPDKRYSFDYFRPVSLTGDFFDAHRDRATNHSYRTVFNHLAYCVVTRDRHLIWNVGSPRELRFISNLSDSITRTDAHAGPNGLRDYIPEFHAWCFTPSSFELIALELFYLNLIDLTVREISTTHGGEFFVALGPAKDRKLSLLELQQQRFKLLGKAISEMNSQIRFARAGGLLGRRYLILVPDFVVSGLEIVQDRLTRLINVFRSYVSRE